jgi:hypothetical protein
MATQNDVRRVALALPDAAEDPYAFSFRVDGKMFVWLWKERVDPKKARVPNPGVIAVRVAGDIDKQMLLAMDREIFFTEPHYDGYNAVLVRLPKISRALLKKILTEAWATRSGSPARRPRPASEAPRARRLRPRRG